MKRYDAIFLGGGGAAYPGAFYLASHGKKVLMMDPKGVLGGNCLYEGCIPSKVLFEVAKIRRREQAFFEKGVKLTVNTPSYGDIVRYKDYIQNRRFRMHDEEIRMHDENLTFVKASGIMKDPHTVTVNGKEDVQGEYIVISTGSKPHMPNIPGKENTITSHDLLKPGTAIQDLPHGLIIIGGGYVGCEFAGIFSSLGTNVTLLDMMDRILPNAGKDAIGLLERRLTERGVSLKLGRRIMEIQKDGERRRVITDNGSFEADHVVMATGRVPNLDGLENMNLERGKLGELITDEFMNVPKYENIYATGDVNGKSMLFHAAVLMSRIAAINILGNRRMEKFDPSKVPSAIYTDPQIGSVGISPVNASDGHIVKRYDLSMDSRDQIEGMDEGFIDLVAEKGSGRIVGAEVVGNDADFLIGYIAQAVSAGLTLGDLSRIAAPHPTSLEAVSSLSRSMLDSM
ncbi:MAG: dihydrolipoyl dehydrogenase [Nitrososphaerota archaeon]|nr:dihydrolipoyl dehydrogenase [Nitrososphaerota archaeon]MDG7039355.1 dihydrolipoyl dehydrogenase [Nitrososphaerota archaeon]